MKSMDGGLFDGLLPLVREYTVAVECAVTSGLGDGSAEEYLRSLDLVGDRLEVGNVPVVFMATGTSIAVKVRACDRVTALIEGLSDVAEATAGRRLELRGARIIEVGSVAGAEVQARSSSDSA